MPISWTGSTCCCAGPSSFYFVLLDNSLSKPQEKELKDKGVDGEMWAVHGGGFYHSNKYMVAPRWKPLPDNLHWSYWESYTTWLTGFALFTVLYLFNAGSFLIDKTVFDWSPAAAIGASLGFLVAFWLIYDLICRSLGRKSSGDLIVGALVFVFVIFASWLACQLFAGRAAFLLVGAMLATTMSANVFFWIIPGQRTVVADLRAGRTPDAIHGQRGKQRSVHNTYFTLPVIVAMLSNHYGWLYQGPNNWLVLVLLMLAGALIRHSFVVLLGMAIWLAPAPLSAEAVAAAKAAAAQPAGYAQVRAVLDQRCTLCHSAEVQQKNVRLDTAQDLKQHAQAVYQQASVLKLMPLSNATQITDAERALIKRWYESGAPVN